MSNRRRRSPSLAHDLADKLSEHRRAGISVGSLVPDELLLEAEPRAGEGEDPKRQHGPEPLGEAAGYCGGEVGRVVRKSPACRTLASFD